MVLISLLHVVPHLGDVGGVVAHVLAARHASLTGHHHAFRGISLHIVLVV